MRLFRLFWTADCGGAEALDSLPDLNGDLLPETAEMFRNMYAVMRMRVIREHSWIVPFLRETLM